ncbi:hypothetical protein AD948_08715 [Acetobacter senegalensis]|uniref:Uncharacterized protein n=1 Tax=Acetobacter senegalensis TaxID=446692 RepID=A0A149U257_9PROT|nr:hypothetical protein AD948_08715 [Acetobacter senegalensis]
MGYMDKETFCALFLLTEFFLSGVSLTHLIAISNTFKTQEKTFLSALRSYAPYLQSTFHYFCVITKK